MQWLLKNFGKKLSLTLTSFVLVVLNQKWGLGIAEESVQKLVELAMVYVGGQSVADGLSGGKTSSLT